MNKSTECPVALVTGASQRIGLAICQSLHQQGFRIIIHYHTNRDQAQELALKLNKIKADSATIFGADLCCPEAIKTLSKYTIEKWGRLDALVNNASVFETDTLPNSQCWTSCLSQWQQTLDLNIRAAFLLSHALSHTLGKTAGSIVNLIDIYGEYPLENRSIYSVSKAGMGMLTKSLALEFAPNIRVNGISPGAIMWPNNDSNLQHQQQILSKIPLSRLGSTKAIAETLLYLLRCDYITGQIIKVDGGRSIAI